jgi:hypothetical protein
MKTFIGGMWDFMKETAFSMILQSSRHQRANVLSHSTWRNSRTERTWSLAVAITHRLSYQAKERERCAAGFLIIFGILVACIVGMADLIAAVGLDLLLIVMTHLTL